jgi:AcrR family transcriptional regulator
MIDSMPVEARGKRRARSEDELPAELRRLWRLEAPGSGRGRPAALDVESVVKAAVALADRDGLTGVTLPRIAKALGCSAMALYRYVGSKEALWALMCDLAIGPPPPIDTRPGEWREGLRQWAAAERRVHHRRPWLARLPITGPPAGPNQVAWMESGLRVLRGTRLEAGEKLGLMMLINGYVRQTTLLSQDLERGRAATGLDEAQVARRYGRSLARLIDSTRFPETARLLASGVFETSPGGVRDDPAADPDFAFGLERILDGIDAAVARHGRRRRQGNGRLRP